MPYAETSEDFMADTTQTIPADQLGFSQDRLNRLPEYFQPYLDANRLPCLAMLVSRHGEVAHLSFQGQQKMGEGAPIGMDTIYRIYSMTKPITSVAAMMLFEEGKLRLEHEVSRYLPEFADVKVLAGGTADAPQLKDPERPMTVHDCLTHMSGVTYGFLQQTEVDAMYRAAKIGAPHESLRDMVRRIAGLPLVFSPGSSWNYGHSTDIVGAIIEVVSGQSLDVFFRERIFGPLGMIDTDFFVPENKLHRLAGCYAKVEGQNDAVLYDDAGSASKLYTKQPPLLNAGGGLVSTLSDYHQFCCMLLNGGSLNGHQLLSPKTVDYMTLNHLPGNKTISEMGDKTFSEARMEGNGFGLLGSVTVDTIELRQPSSLGNFAWGGLASTYFWIDPEEEIIGIQMTQLMPSSTYPIRPQFQQLVYASITD